MRVEVTVIHLTNGVGKVVCSILELMQMQTQPPNKQPAHRITLDLGHDGGLRMV